MALRPPDDFRFASSERAHPSDAQLREMWDRQEAARGARERTAAWRLAQERLRRDAAGGLRQADSLPTYLREADTYGPRARAALRPVPRRGRVFAAGIRCAGLRRLDVAADLRTDSAVEGLALLECVASASFGAGKLAAYRAERRTESVLVKTRAGRTLARVYDKGAQRSALPGGRWLRFEAQWRFPRPSPQGQAPPRQAPSAPPPSARWPFQVAGRTRGRSHRVWRSPLGDGRHTRWVSPSSHAGRLEACPPNDRVTGMSPQALTPRARGRSASAIWSGAARRSSYQPLPRQALASLVERVER
jgi:hypothetical protein